MNDYGISKVLPNLSLEKINEVVRRLNEDIKVNECGLDGVEIEDLTEDGLLGKGAARKLVNEWKAGVL